MKELFDANSGNNIALYGLGTETERFLNENSCKLSIVGLLDGFRSDGEMYGYPIISLDEVPEKGVKLIIVIARPGSCKAISKRIGDFCKDKGILLYDVRGRNLLDTVEVTYDFKKANGESKEVLITKIAAASVVSFDLFDTLVMRKIKSYTDVFDVVDARLKEKKIIIPNVEKKRVHSEKELSKVGAPRLWQIYEYILNDENVSQIDPHELAQMEWETDFSLLTVREAVRDVFCQALSMGKKVVITTDCYYAKEQIAHILEKFEFSEYDDLIVSCEYGTSKTQKLFQVLSKKFGEGKILHIGDDEYADVENAKVYGIDTFRVYSANALFDSIGGLGTDTDINSVADSVKIGLFLSRIFNDPFWFEDDEKRLSVKDASDIGYLFCAPMITDFTLWMKKIADEQGYRQILFVARDGYLLEKLFRMMGVTKGIFYFHSSRTAAIRAGMESQQDIDYVDGMKFFGTPEKALKVRFGIAVDDIESVERSALILEKSSIQKEYYQKYIDNIGIDAGKIAMFDFVAKGTTQMYLQKLFLQHMKGFYFLQLEPEFMADKELDIEPFYSDDEKNTSAIFDNYYILETILTAPYPQMLEMDCAGNPVFAKETRSGRDLDTLERMQQGVIDFFEDYFRILPEKLRKENKRLDEILLGLINHVLIKDEDFLCLKVEDPFFGRMTDIKDVIGV